MARKYNVEGTKAFMIWGIVLLLLGIWCVMDGWFPSESTVTAHPLDKASSFYAFNKSLAILSLVGAAICGYIHLVVK